MEKHYYGVFREEEGKVLVSIPDVAICETFGDTWEEAFEMAVDALAACISTGKNNRILCPSKTKWLHFS